MGSLITTKLREDALELRKLASKSLNTTSSLSAVKERMLCEIHLILTLMLGPPPKPSKDFTWDYYDKNDKFHSVTTTPLKFATQLSSSDGIRACAGTDVHELFSLVNDPRNEYGELLSVNRLGNVFGARGVTYVNVDMQVSLPLKNSSQKLTVQDHQNRLHLHAQIRPPHLLRLRCQPIQQFHFRHHGYWSYRLRARLQH